MLPGCHKPSADANALHRPSHAPKVLVHAGRTSESAGLPLPLRSSRCSRTTIQTSLQTRRLRRSILPVGSRRYQGSVHSCSARCWDGPRDRNGGTCTRRLLASYRSGKLQRLSVMGCCSERPVPGKLGLRRRADLRRVELPTQTLVTPRALTWKVSRLRLRMTATRYLNSPGRRHFP